MHKTLIENSTIKHIHILVICSGPICSNAMQLLTLIRGFGLYFHKNRPEEAILNDIMQAVTFQQM